MFPACAGVNRVPRDATRGRNGVPRVRGDELEPMRREDELRRQIEQWNLDQEDDED